MRKIDLSGYDVNGQEYRVKDTLVQILFHPDLKLGARDLVIQDAIARKIEGSNESVLLEETEYQKVKTAVETPRGYQRADMEFVSRVVDAPEVDVKEA
jgi:hypothetical protein